MAKAFPKIQDFTSDIFKFDSRIENGYTSLGTVSGIFDYSEIIYSVIISMHHVSNYQNGSTY